VLAGVVGKIVWDIRYGRADPEVAKARRVIFNSIKKKFYKVLLLTGGVIAGLTAFRVANHVVDAPASTATDVAVDATGVPIVQIETVEVPHQQHY